MLNISYQERLSITQNQVTMPKTTAEEKTVRADFVVDDAVVEVKGDYFQLLVTMRTKCLISFDLNSKVKSCVCADYQKDSAPPSNKKDRYVIVSRYYLIFFMFTVDIC